MFGPSCRLWHQMLDSAPSSVEILTAAPCKKIKYGEVNGFFLICAEVLASKFNRAEIRSLLKLRGHRFKI